MRIYVIGNPLIEDDSIAIRIAKELREKFPKIEFIETDTLSELMKFEKIPIIMDAAQGVKKVESFTGTEKIETKDVYSLHDMDLAFEIKLLKKLGKINDARIIAIPRNYDLKKAVEEVEGIISDLHCKKSADN